VDGLTSDQIKKDTPWLKWRAELCVPSNNKLQLDSFRTADDAARAYDAEVRRRGWAHVRPLNFPQPEERAAYAQAKERCDERGLPLTLAPELSAAAAAAAAAAQGSSGQRPPKLSGRKPGKSGFFGVWTDAQNKCYKATPWQAFMNVPITGDKYVIGQFATKKEAARAYDAEVQRRGWTHLERLNLPDPADDATLQPSAAASERPGPCEGRGAGLT